MCIYDTIHMYVVCVKCGDCIYTYVLTILKYICIIHVCVEYVLTYYTIVLYICVFSYIMYYLYICVCVCKQLVVCSSDPYVCPLATKNECFGTYSGFV